MAVQQNKKSRSRKGMRRSHDHLAIPTYVLCPDCGTTVRSHSICPKCGCYKGRQVVTIKKAPIANEG
ncbi:MAG: 50S ribosomal protein L32 [Desulfovibrionaceae bacterium]|nr:50S ribosomal protein L32 [Desulfovibrionaceae bacterium]